MASIRVLLARALELFLRRRRDDRLAEEIAAHLDMLADAHMARGMTAAEARVAAGRAFGSVAAVRSEYRDQRGMPSVDALARDVRLAARLLGKDWRFTTAVVLTLGLAIGVNTSIFTLIDMTLIRELPFRDPDRLVRLGTLNEQGNRIGLSYREFHDWSRAADTLAGLAASIDGTVSLSGDGSPAERVHGSFVSTNLFDLLGRTPVLGRGLATNDGLPGAVPVVVLSDRTWQRRYGGDPSVIGRVVRVDDVPSTIVGVMPRGFKFPLIAQVWLPLHASGGVTVERRDSRNLLAVGRLGESAGVEQVQRQLDTLAARGSARKAVQDADGQPFVAPLRGSIGGNVKPVLVTLMAAVGAVLLIACANIAGLLLVRSAMRTREIAIRSALGASRSRIVSQLLVECAMLAALAGVLGAILSGYGAALLATGFDVVDPGAAPGDTTPYWVDLTMNRAVYGFVAVACVVSCAAFGLVPALLVARTDLSSLLKGGSWSIQSIRRWTAGFVVAEVAVTLVLLTGTGLLWRSFLIQYEADVVIDTSHVITTRLALPAVKYSTAERRSRFVDELQERVSGADPFGQVTIASDAPFGPPGARRRAWVHGRAAPDAAGVVSFVTVSPGYFETLRLPIVRGRALGSGDAAAGGREVVVDERFVELLLDGADPIGSGVQLSDAAAAQASGPLWTIAGVARTVPAPGLRGATPRPTVYAPLASEEAPPAAIAIMVRATDVTAAVRRLRADVAALDSSLPLHGIEMLDAAAARPRYPQRLIGTWLAILGALALVLSSIGIYSVTAHGVAARTREIGVRMALGALPSRVTWLFLRDTTVRLVAGMVLGLGGSFLARSYFQYFPIQVSPTDLLTLATVATVMAGVGTAAGYFPARRAARVDPIVTLRHE